MRITKDHVNHPNALDDAEIKLKPHTPHIMFVDVINENKYSMVIFVNLAVEQKERLLKQENMLDSNSFENIVDIKVKLHACSFPIFNLSRKNFKKISKICIFIFNKIKIKKIVQADLYFVKLKKINFDI